MDNPTDKRMIKSCWIGLLLCFIIYFLVAFFGYATYGSEITKTNFLVVIDPNEDGIALYIIMNISFIVNVLFSMPVIFFSARNCFMAFLDILFS